MRTWKKASGIFVIIFAFVLCFAGCSGKANSSEEAGRGLNERETYESKEDEKKIDIADIDWSVDEGIVDGKRYVLFHYTNHSPYTISKFELHFSERSDITEEEKESYFVDAQEYFEFSDEDMEEVKQEPISMHAETERVVEPEESADNIYCYYYEGFYYLKNIYHYKLTEPDIATISYVNGEQIYTVYYDFHSGKYTMDDNVKKAHYWTKSELGKKIPRPEAKIIEENGEDSESLFEFRAYGYTLEQFDSYVEECKTAGYTKESISDEDYYSADSEEGYNILLNYDERNRSFECEISASEK